MGVDWNIAVLVLEVPHPHIKIEYEVIANAYSTITQNARNLYFARKTPRMLFGLFSFQLVQLASFKE